MIEKDCGYWKFSSDINEDIRVVLNFILFFLRKDFARTKSTKSTESPKRHKGTQTKAEKLKQENKWLFYS